MGVMWRLMTGLLMAGLLSGCSSSGETVSVSGHATSGNAGLAGVALTLSGPNVYKTTTDSAGNYSFGNIPEGTYTLTPVLAGYTFVPTSRSVYCYGIDAVGFNFSLTATGRLAMSGHTLFVNRDGTSLRTWGKDDKGQLGDGGTTDRVTPWQATDPADTTGMTPLTDVVQIAAGYDHTVVLKKDGTVWAWGGNGQGQIGNNKTSVTELPQRVSTLTGISAVAAGDRFSLALKSDGTVWAWGLNDKGQLGNGTTTDSAIPVQVSYLTSITAIAAGQNHVVARRNDGLVFAWGCNGKGQLGNGTTTDSTTAVQVSSLLTATVVAAGQGFSLALKSNGTVWAWGLNDKGQLGNATTTDVATPVQVSGQTTVVAIAAGNDHALSLKSDGAVWAWGDNSDGQLGTANATLASSSTPVQVPGLTGMIALAAGVDASAALKSDETLWTWGANAYGQLGNGDVAKADQPAPKQIF